MQLKEYDLEKHESTKVPTPGICIYCREELPPEKLTDEHVIPYALGANTMIYQKASCVPCARTIQPYEQEVLSKQWGNFRIQMEAPSRTKRKYRKTHHRVAFVEMDDHGNELRDLGKLNIPIVDLPLALTLWQLSEPGILFDADEARQHVNKPWVWIEQAVAERWNRKVGTETGSKNVAMHVGDVSRSCFLRFLAKTAHAYATAALGTDGFEPLLQDIILDRSHELDHYVGGTFPEPQHSVHHGQVTTMGLGRIDDFVAARLQFYPGLNSPAYMVVVGKVNDVSEERLLAAERA